MRRQTVFGIFLAAICSASTAQALTLYDDSLAQTPDDQGWMTLVSTSGATASSVAAGVRINTGTGGVSPADEAGWFNQLPLPPIAGGGALPVNPGFPVLDSSLGFSLSFELQIHAESHGMNNDRAGFSVILLDSNAIGVELGFWGDEIWAQSDSPLFTHAESAAFDTLSSEVLYELTILGSGYSLSANGSNLLNGGLRDYSAYLTDPFTPDPYEVGSFVFLGDNTDSAFADFTLGDVQIHTGEAQVVLPSVSWLLLLGLLPLARRAR